MVYFLYCIWYEGNALSSAHEQTPHTMHNQLSSDFLWHTLKCTFLILSRPLLLALSASGTVVVGLSCIVMWARESSCPLTVLTLPSPKSVDYGHSQMLLIILAALGILMLSQCQRSYLLFLFEEKTRQLHQHSIVIVYIIIIIVIFE